MYVKVYICIQWTMAVVYSIIILTDIINTNIRRHNYIYIYDIIYFTVTQRVISVVQGIHRLTA